MPQGSYTLAQYPLDQVDVACETCGRKGRLSKARLMAKHGGEITLPDLREKIAIEAGCMRFGRMHEPCGLHYPGLVRLRGGDSPS